MCIFARRFGALSENGWFLSARSGTSFALVVCMKEGHAMSRWIAGLIVVSSIVVTGSAQAQETAPGPGKVEVTIVPGGATFFTKKAPAPSFGNYNIGGAAAYNFTRMVGVEGEIGGSLGIRQNLTQLGGLAIKEKTPNMLSYSGNVVVNAPGHSFVPYATGGIGGLAVYHREVLGISRSAALLTGNVGGGLKWFSGSNRWGLRGDYRFMAVQSKTTAPAFFGLDGRNGHRIYGAVIINAVE
jgi:hypothetical protein